MGFTVSCLVLWCIAICKPAQVRPRSLKQSWNWYVALQLLLNKFLLTRFGLGDWKGLFGVVSRANGALMIVVSHHRDRPLAELGCRVAVAGRHWGPIAAGWHAVKMKPRCSFHTRARTLSLSIALSRSHHGEPSVAEPQHCSTIT